MNLNRQALLLFLLIPAWLGPRQLAAQPTPLGRETRVDTDYEFYYDTCPQIGVAPDRSFEIAWSAGLGTPSCVRSRHYNANGAPTDRYEVSVTPEVPIDCDSSGTIAVTPVSTGGFRVLFAGGQSDSPFSRQRIDSKGVVVPGGARPVGAPDTRWVWPGPGDTIFAGKYDASQRRLSMQKVDSRGMPAGTVYTLNTRPIVIDQYEADPIIKPLSDGGWVAVFSGRSLAAPGSPARPVVRVRKFNAAGVPLGPDVDVDSLPAAAPNPSFFFGYTAAAAAVPGGRFAVAWQARNRSGWPIFLRFFDAAGVPVAPETAAVRGRDPEGPISMASDNSGRIFLAWLTDADFVPGYFTFDLRAQLFRPDGSPVGQSFSVQTWVSREYSAPRCGTVVWTGDSWVITWVGWYLEDETAVFLRRFR